MKSKLKLILATVALAGLLAPLSVAQSHARNRHAAHETLSYGRAVPYRSPPVYRYQGYPRRPRCSLLIPDRQMVGVGC
jgi:hypothetical protein